MTEDWRVLAIDGTSNFRDFGARALANGGALPAGKLFRSAHLGTVTPAGEAAIAGLGIARIIDLRGAEERLSALPRFAETQGIEVVSIPIEPRTRPAIAALVASGGASYAKVHGLMVDSYSAYVHERLPQFSAGVRSVVEAGDRPVVIHCTAGKDRTGFLAALLLTAAGVDRETVFADYLMTNQHWAKTVPAPAGMPEDAFAAILEANAAYLETAFAEMEAVSGSVDTYLSDKIGLDHATRDRFARRLTG